jgi:hypothetical protein
VPPKPIDLVGMGYHAYQEFLRGEHTCRQCQGRGLVVVRLITPTMDTWHTKLCPVCNGERGCES